MTGMMCWCGIGVVCRVIEGGDVMGSRVLAAHGLFCANDERRALLGLWVSNSTYYTNNAGTIVSNVTQRITILGSCRKRGYVSRVYLSRGWCLLRRGCGERPLVMEMNVHQSVVRPVEKIAITTNSKRKPFSQSRQQLSDHCFSGSFPHRQSHDNTRS